jgi:DNA-binding transcriptional LysR family regulator
MSFMLDHRIETLLILSETLSYTKTAELLHITQPAVSQHIRYMEKLYGCTFFMRNGRKLTITPAGSRLIRAAQIMQANSRRVFAEMMSDDPVRPLLRLGATKTIGNYVIARPLADFIKQHPEYDLELVVDNTSALLGKLDQGDLDLLFLEGNFDKQRYHHDIYQVEDFIGVCCPDNPLKICDSVKFADLMQQRLIIREPGSGTREIFEQLLQQHSYSLAAFNNTIVISQFEVIKELVQADVGVSFMYRAVVAEELREGKLSEFMFEGGPYTHEFNIVRLAESVVSPEIEAFAGVIADWQKTT